MFYTCLIISTLIVIVTFSSLDFATLRSWIARKSGWTLTAWTMIVYCTYGRWSTWIFGKTWIDTLAVSTCLTWSTFWVRRTSNWFRWKYFLTSDITLTSISRQTSTGHCSQRQSAVHITPSVWSTRSDGFTRVNTFSVNTCLFTWTVLVFFASIINWGWDRSTPNSVWITCVTWNTGTNTSMVTRWAISVLSTITRINTLFIPTCQCSMTIWICQTFWFSTNIIRISDMLW